MFENLVKWIDGTSKYARHGQIFDSLLISIQLLHEMTAASTDTQSCVKYRLQPILNSTSWSPVMVLIGG